MSHPVIPAPVRSDSRRRPVHAAVRHPDRLPRRPELAPIAERCSEEVSRRTGLRIEPTAGRPRRPGPDEPSIRIELAAEQRTRDRPRASRPAAVAPDERYDLTITTGQVLVRAAEPVGVARGLTTLTQLLAATPEATNLPGARITDAPRYAWRGLSLDLARTYLTPAKSGG